MLKTTFACGLILMFTLAEDAQGQRIGGLVKKTVEKATKPKEAEPTKDAAKDEAKEKSLFSFEMNADAMASYKRGLDVEIKARNDFRAQLAKLKTVEEYGTCQQSALMSPDGVKMAEEAVARMEKAKTPDDYQKLASWQTEAYEKLFLKVCGEDPERLRQQQSDVFRKGAQAGADEAGKVWKQSSETNLRDYRLMKELAAKYCSLPADLRQDAEKNGIRVQGTGSNIFWVFPAGFTQWVGPECDDLLRRDKMLDGSSSN